MIGGKKEPYKPKLTPNVYNPPPPVPMVNAKRTMS